MVFDNRILYCRDSLILLFLPLPLPDIVLFVPLSMMNVHVLMWVHSIQFGD